MKFIHLTDTHIRWQYDNDGIDAILGQLKKTAPDLEYMLSHTAWEDIDAVIITGDLVHEGTARDYAYVKEMMEKNVPAHVKILYVLGNHDNKEAFYEGVYGEKKSEPYYYTETADGYRLVVLDSAVPGKESGMIVEEELAWLKEVLKQPYGKGSIVFLHHPLFWVAKDGESMAAKNGHDVLNILKDTDVFAVFCGHTHTNAVNTSGEMLQFTADSAAFSLETRGNNLVFTDKSGYAVVEVHGKNVSVHQETMAQDTAVVEIPLDIFAEQLRKMDQED